MLFALLAAAAAAPAAPADPDEVVITGQQSAGSEDYAIKAQTTATRIPLSLRETPQSVSVVTRAQIQDFQLNEVNQLLATVPGVNVEASETDRVTFSARGFDIQTFQLDGIGVPFAFGIQTGSIDTAIYDHIEVLKGAAGLLSSTGNPSAVVNFVRKRPTRDLVAQASAQYGSFDSLRLDADVSVPLTSDGSIRARGVGVYSDADSYLDRYQLKRWTGYGIVEADLGPSTTLSGGYGHQDHQSRGAMWGAMPIYYTDGTLIDLPRSANTGTDWAGWGVIDRQIFGDLTHEFGNGWVARLSAVRRAQNEDNELFYVFNYPVRGAPNGIGTGPGTDGVLGTADDVPIGVTTYPGKFTAETRNLTVEGYVTGPVSLFGRDHDVMVGVNRSAQKYQQSAGYDFSTVGIVLPLSRVYDGSFARPNFPTPELALDQHTRRETAYGLVRLNPADPVKLMLGGNLTHSKSDGISYGTPSNFDNTRFLPFVGTMLDVTSALTLYGSYATIFNPQTATDVTNRVLDPIKGSNLEAGIKGAWFGDRLNASIAVFQTRQDNTAQTAGFANGRTFSVGVDAKSEGIEFEFGGEVAPGLRATGGYTLMRVEDEDGAPARTFVPRNTGRLNVSYSPPALPALKVGASGRYQSRIYLNAPTGYRLVQGGYTLIDLLGSYALTDNLSVAVNVRNVTNRKYLTALTFDAGYFGAPRAVLGTVTLRY